MAAPNSKWDWYEIGGRWDGGIPTRDGGRTNRCRLGDIDMSSDADAYERAIEWWRVAVEGGEAPEGATPGDYRCLYSADYMRDQYGDADGYARAHSGFGTYAVLDDAGEWHEPGRMGWFGVSDAGGGARGDFARGYAEMLASFDQDLIATLVDCHI